MDPAPSSFPANNGLSHSNGLPHVLNYTNDVWSQPSGTGSSTVLNPSTGTEIGVVSYSSESDVDKAVAAARSAQQGWAATPIKERAQLFFRYKALLERHRNDLAAVVNRENGKVMPEAVAEIEKAIEVTEFACAMPHMTTGEILEVSKGVECRIDRHPVGVVASITPFNFPSMVPHWTIPNALVLGNAFILKPSPLVPLSSLMIAELLTEAGLPPGLFSITHGGQETVELLCDHPGVDALTFVGSTKVAKAVYQRATSSFKRVVALGGAKNHILVLPDAHPDMAASNIAASMSGCAGQRCMAASAMIAVGPSDHIIERLIQEARKLIPGKNLGPVISRHAKERIERYITEAEREGAKVVLDGRGAAVLGHEGGFFVGPTIIDRVRPDMKIAQEEVFGPVLAIMRAETLDEALRIENASPYGNAASVFTQSGAAARVVMERASAGMVGVNIGVPVPREPFSFGGWNESKFGACDITGKSSIEFFTRQKKTTIKWNPEARAGWMS